MVNRNYLILLAFASGITSTAIWPGTPAMRAVAPKLVRCDEAQLAPWNVMAGQQPHDYKPWSPKQHPQGRGLAFCPAILTHRSQPRHHLLHPLLADVGVNLGGVDGRLTQQRTTQSCPYCASALIDCLFLVAPTANRTDGAGPDARPGGSPANRSRRAAWTPRAASPAVA